MNTCSFLALLMAAGLCISGGLPATDEALAVGRVLDDFHDAAARADGDRYFGHFAPEGVFLGTDPTERWTVDEFRAWAAPHFEGESAWTFTARERHVTLAPGGAVAWFDEVAVSETAGEWRGTGALRKIEGAWKITQYNLTVPIPNDLLRDVVDRIRADADGDAAETVTTVFVVRHAEKLDSGDPDTPLSPAGWKRAARLARMLERAGLSAVFATQYQRTQQTVSPAAGGVTVKPTIVDAGREEELARRILADHAGESVLVSGHSNTVPRLIRALGVEETIEIAGDDYDNLFVITVTGSGAARLLHLRFGD